MWGLTTWAAFLGEVFFDLNGRLGQAMAVVCSLGALIIWKSTTIGSIFGTPAKIGTKVGLKEVLVGGGTAALGLACWIAIPRMTHIGEAWDNIQFYYPALLVIGFLGGWMAPERVWRWGLSTMGCQAVYFVLLGGWNIGSKLIGIPGFLLLAVLPYLGALAGQGVRRHGLPRCFRPGWDRVAASSAR